MDKQTQLYDQMDRITIRTLMFKHDLTEQQAQLCYEVIAKEIKELKQAIMAYETTQHHQLSRLNGKIWELTDELDRFKDGNILYYDNEQKIKDLLFGRKITEIEEDRLILDNGTELQIIPNEGCGGCSAGWYEITHLATVDNAITKVELVCEQVGDSQGWEEDEKVYSIFVYADNEKINAVEVSGDDGNGYYGTGYKIFVKNPFGKVDPYDR